MPLFTSMEERVFRTWEDFVSALRLVINMNSGANVQQILCGFELCAFILQTFDCLCMSTHAMQ